MFLVALVVTALLLGWLMRSVEATERAAFEAEAARTAEALRERVDTTVTLLRGAAGLFAANGSVREDQFAHYVAQLRLRERYPGIQGIGYSQRVEAQEEAALVARMRQGGHPQFRIWPDRPVGESQAIVLIEPRDARNVTALGYDMTTEPTRRAAMERARDEAAPAASGRVTLVQEIDAAKQAGFLIYLPVYQGGVVPEDLETRRRALAGLVYAPLRVGDLLAGVRGGDSALLDYALYDGLEPRSGALLRSTLPVGGASPRHATRVRLVVAGRPWLLALSSRPEFEDLSQRRMLPWLALLSLFASGLLARITYVQASSRRAAEHGAAQLEGLAAQLRESDRRKDEFIAVLAHELRNPLAPIRTALEILERVPEGEQARRARAIAARQLRHMVRLVDDLLDVSRISRGKIVLQRRQLPLAEPVQAAVETSRPLMEARRHRLEVGPVDPALRVDGDPTRLAQILTNLLNNAATYTPEGGRVTVDARAEGDAARVTVRDSGIGIDPRRLQQVFELFVQVDRSGTGGGLGIGLNLAARLAELHGGRIEAHSDGLGQGAAFTLVLPLAGPLPPR